MKLNVSKKSFIAAVKAVLPAVPSRPGLPVLACVRLDGAGNLISVKATDLELAIEQFVALEEKAERPGEACVPAKMLLKALQAVGGDEVTLESASEGERSGLHVRSGSRTVTLEACPSDEWPEFPSHTDTVSVASADASVLADALARCAICASTDEARPILTSVALSFEAGSATMQVVATDSYRLGMVDVPLPAEPIAPEGPLLVPARVAKALAKRLKGEREVRILREEGSEGRDSRVVFSFGGTDWWVRTIEGEFPNWRQVMPEPEGACLDAGAEDLESALKAAASMRKDSAPVRLSLDGSCKLTLSEPDVGTVTEELEGARFSPDGIGPLEIAFNPDYLLDGLRFVGEERIRMWLRDGLKPGLLEGPDRRYAVMPIRSPR